MSTDADAAVEGPSPVPNRAQAPRVSSPASTGGAGTTFEQHVGAYWLAQLLVRGIPPILIGTAVGEVSFQTERLGWQTDDILIVCEHASTASRKLAVQVKRAFTVSASNAECAQAIGDFWKDFNNAEVFSRESDRLALITLRGTDTLLEHFVGLLDCARASHDGADFERRLSTPGFISKAAVRYCGEVQEIVGALEGHAISLADLWPFLCVLHVLSLDLHSSTRQAEAQIKNLLALTATEGEPIAISTASWNELVGEASAAMADGRTLHHADLPAALRARHGAIDVNERGVLRILAEHTAPVLRGIHTTVGPDLHLPRSLLAQKVLDALQTAQVVIVTGPAGSGKSAIAKGVAGILGRDHFLFAFRAEEFAQPHFDATLTAAQVPANGAKLAAILAVQDRKVVLVESVERLLEKTTRDAFADLMTLAADDRSLRIVLTCRDYSLDLVRTSFLESDRIDHTLVRIPPLDDQELGEVQAAYPALAIPLGSRSLRDILRNPFILDKALGIQWSTDKPLPQSEREFRAVFWCQIVRADHRVPAGMARRREETLETIAVRRARALSAHVRATDLDQAVIESLRGDSLIVSPEEGLELVATAHDVLEDWAIVQWLEEQHLGEDTFGALSAAIGTNPAVRRSYRTWVAELVESDPVAADRLFQAAVTEIDISVQFRDDTLVSLLKAPSAPEFLARHEAQLVANDRAILKRIIHLLRVGCVKTPDWLARFVPKGSILNVPDGAAWPAVLRLAHRNLAAFAPNERLLLIGLVEDSVRGVSWEAPDVEGAEHVAGIAYWLLEGMRGYGRNEPRKRVLQAIAKIPKADPARFEATLRGHIDAGERRDPVAEDFQELIFAGLDGMPAARYLPDPIVSVGADYLLASEEDLADQRGYMRGGLDLELYFGIKEGLRHDFFPASPYRGPWGALLRFHPGRALGFYIKVFNHSADWFAHPRLRERLEPPFEVELTFGDGTSKMHWANGRLWGLYRGMTVGPYVLQSMLMALEIWLLELAKSSPAQLDSVLVDVLRRGHNGALAAVVASVATAYPHAASEALLALLSARDYIEMDCSRGAAEPQLAGITGMLSTLRADHQAYEMERKQANALPHRSRDLEGAILNLQVGPAAARVQRLLDKHLAALPPKDQQEEQDKLWRLAIHRMDLREYTLSATQDPEIPDGDAAPGESPRRWVRLDPKPPDADVQAMVESGAERLAEMNARFGILVWGISAFRRESGKHDPAQWAAKLAEAQAMDRETDHQDGSRHGPGFVAAVCLRDRWDEMTPDQRDWCIGVVCAEVLRHADDVGHMERARKNPMAADRACAFMLASLLRMPIGESKMDRIRDAFAAAITHPVEEVRSYAAWSIDEALWTEDRDLALRCVCAIATEAALIDAARAAEEARPYNRQVADIIAEAGAHVRQRFWQEGAFADDAHATLDISDGFGADALNWMLVVFGRAPQDKLAVAAFLRASNCLAEAWKADDDPGHGRSRNFHTDADVSEQLERFLLRTSPETAQRVLVPLLATVDRHSRELQGILDGLTVVEDSNPNTPQYWSIWSLFADAVKGAAWVSRLDEDRHPDGSDLLSAVFLTSNWKDDVRHWRSLEGYAHLVHELFEALPPTSIVLDNYARFLYHIGEQSLPDAFVRVAAALQRGDAPKMLSKSDTVFMLEALLRHHVYGRPLELKREVSVRDAVLFILDCLVETGSSAAFRMRDDFVTPTA